MKRELEKIGIMKKLFYSMVMIGMVMGIIFPYFVQEFVILEVDLTFRVACILAGIIVGILNYLLIRVILKNHLAPIILTAKEIANRNFNLEIKGKPYKYDILSELYESIISMASSLKETHEKLTNQAKIDSLTNLYNRTFFNESFSSLSNEGFSELKLALLYLDLDNFKYINDTYGHSVGDRALQMVAERLLDCVRVMDIIVRMGGDEFTIVLPGIKDETYINMVAQRVLEKIGEPMSICGQEITISVSIGIGIYPSDGNDICSLLNNADAAMYHAKKNNKGFSFYKNLN
ncbi:MAG: hypothetical protein APF84_06225 [Gracilibacter sp. BRH_c7a]|nr:MAG: hypothetical protein APF84_06225 [Gracilibacter sp. BRH_c7a]